MEPQTKADYICEPISYESFFETYLLPNKLCVLGPWLTKNWLCRKKWVSENGRFCPDYMKQQFGDISCPIANCKKEECGSHIKSEMTFTEFMDYMTKYKANGYPKEMDCLYLKDWHCVRNFPAYDFYSTPIYFSSDWLNEFWDKRSDNLCDDYRFVYVGPKGTWTPFHSDVFRSFSWSANICGKKKWVFFPPGEEKQLEDINGHLPYDIYSSDLQDHKKYPNIEKITQRVEIIQNEGEVVFVPSGWHHQVFNLEDTISINHNWINGCNILNSWNFLSKSLTDVQEEIKDCHGMDGWDKQCQLILKSTSGIDYTEFYHFIELIVRNRIRDIGKYTTTEEKISNIIKVHLLNLSSDSNLNKNNVLENLEQKVRDAVQEIIAFISKSMCDAHRKEFPAVPDLLHKRLKNKTLFTNGIVEAVAVYDKVQEELDLRYTKCYENYGWHFPELKYVLKDMVTYAQVVTRLGDRKNVSCTDFSDILNDDLKEQVEQAAECSMGMNVTNEAINSCQITSEQVIEIFTYKTRLLDFIHEMVRKSLPTFTCLIDDDISIARVVAYAKTISNLNEKKNKPISFETSSAKADCDKPSCTLNTHRNSDTGVEHGLKCLTLSDGQATIDSSNLPSTSQLNINERSKQTYIKDGTAMFISNKHVTKPKLTSPVFADETECNRENHLYFDLEQANSVVKAMLNDSAFQYILQSRTDTELSEECDAPLSEKTNNVDNDKHFELEPESLLRDINYCWKSLGCIV